MSLILGVSFALGFIAVAVLIASCIEDVAGWLEDL